ncbi:MAG: MoaD/ThiS family protein [Actinomycetales bacterium]|nr:MoaD/ThiS family protein [Actinomycetales bacterium]
MAHFRFFASTRAVVGAEHKAVSDFDLPPHVNTALLRDMLVKAYPQARNLFMTCTFLADGARVGDRLLVLDDFDTIDVLPPFAGG